AVVPFLAHYNRTGSATSGEEPSPTMTTRDRCGVVDPTAVAIEDCGFRMLEPHEAGAAMAFPDSYQVDGSKRTRVRLYGQAVTPPVSAEISSRGIASLAG
ncbi:MAG: (cytosine-5)-methyltransferase 1, partial [Actinomycetota bacterium]|nr:(cytosine-5)-methyltransferase 1 [Actinomycetota bacterium]